MTWRDETPEEIAQRCGINVETARRVKEGLLKQETPNALRVRAALNDIGGFIRWCGDEWPGVCLWFDGDRDTCLDTLQAAGLQIQYCRQEKDVVTNRFMWQIGIRFDKEMERES